MDLVGPASIIADAADAVGKISVPVRKPLMVATNPKKGRPKTWLF